MPEYSTPKVTPTETTKIPGMNGNSSGYIDAKDLLDIIRATFGQANGVATLGPDGRLTSSQLPVLADDVIVATSYATLDQPGMPDKLYITADNNKMYRWDDTLATPDYVELSVDLSAYATKTELAAEESAREADISDVKNALTAVDHRVQNLEQAKGDYVPVDSTKGVISTPSGKGKWAVVEKLRGVTRVWNQLVDNPTFDVKGDWTDFLHASTVTVSNNVLTAVENNSNDRVGFGRNLRTTANHSYLCLIRIESATSGLTLEGGIRNFLKTISVGFNALVITTNANSTEVGVASTVGISGATVSCSLFNVKDLNIYFGTTDLSFLGATDSAKLATIQTYYPWLLEPSDYGNSLVSTVYEGVRSKSRNLLDPSKLNSAGTWSDGKLTTTPSALFNATLTDGWSDISFIPNTQYYLRAKLKVDSSVSSLRLQVNYTDGTTSSSSGVSGGGENYVYITTTSGKSVKNVLFNYSSGGSGTAIVSELIFNKSDSQDGTFTSYWTPSTLSLPTPITLRSAGTVAEEFDLKSGEKTNPLGSYTFTGNESWTSYNSVSKRTDIANLGAKNVGAGIVPNLINDMGLLATSRNAITGSGGITVSVTTIIISNDSVALATAGKKIYFELETALAPTQLDPIQNPTILTESGGTITAQTEEPIDGNFSVGFITL